MLLSACAHGIRLFLRTHLGHRLCVLLDQRRHRSVGQHGCLPSRKTCRSGFEGTGRGLYHTPGRELEIVTRILPAVSVCGSLHQIKLILLDVALDPAHPSIKHKHKTANRTQDSDTHSSPKAWPMSQHRPDCKAWAALSLGSAPHHPLHCSLRKVVGRGFGHSIQVDLIKTVSGQC